MIASITSLPIPFALQFAGVAVSSLCGNCGPWVIFFHLASLAYSYHLMTIAPVFKTGS